MIEEHLWEDEDGVRVMSEGRVRQVMKEMAEMTIDECVKEVILWEKEENTPPTGWLKDRIRAVKISIK